MAVSIDWGTKVITVPKADLTLISGTLYSFDVDAFRLELKGLEDSEEGMAHPDTHRHNTEVVIAGVTYARSVEIINGYTVTFEAGSYTVSCTGANHNVSDVLNYSGVSLIVNNAAGLQTVTQGSGVTAQDIIDIGSEVWSRSMATRSPGTAAGILVDGGFVDRAVYVDPVEGTAGTTFPIGTESSPVNNITQALAIAAANDLNRICLSGPPGYPIATGATDVLGQMRFFSKDPVSPTMEITAGTTTYGTHFNNLQLTGEFNGPCMVTDCGITPDGITNFWGGISDTTISGDIGFGTTAPTQGTLLINVVLAANPSPEFTFGAIGFLYCSNLKGEVTIAGKSSADVVHLDLSDGKVHLDGTVTNGAFTIEGYGELLSNNATGISLDTSGLITSTAALDAALADHRIDGSVGDVLARTGFEEGAVHLDPLHGSAGTAYPMGTATKPVDSFTDAIAICTANGLKKIKVSSNFDTPATLLPGQDISGYYIYGGEASVPLVYLVTGSVTSYTLFEKVLVSGDVGGSAIVITDGGITNVTNCDAVLTRCIILGTISMDAPSCQLDLIQTSGSVNRLWGTSEIDFNGATTTNMSWQDVAGEIVISNLAGTGSTIPVTLAGGKLTFESTVTGGSFVISGHGDVVDNSVGATIDTTGLRPLRTQFDNTELARAILQNKTITDPGTGVMTIYDEDGVTPLYTANIFEDAAGTQPYQGQGVERREALA